MRISATSRLSFEGYWTEESDQSLKTKVFYKLMSYAQLIKTRGGNITPDDIASNVTRITNCYLREIYYPELEEKKLIKYFVNSMQKDYYELLLNEMIDDSFLKIDEHRRLEFIVYYLNWKADEFSRRQSYDCDQCRKFDFIDSRYCYLEDDEYELPSYEVTTNEHGSKDLVESDSKLYSIPQYLEMLNELTIVNQELSVFEISQKYFTNMMDDAMPGKRIELCPEAIKIKSEHLAELFEMEARCSEYGIFPFDGGQFNQPALLVEAFDAIRAGRNMFHSKKMKEVTKQKGTK